MTTEVNNAEAMIDFGRRVGGLCSGGEVIELVGDIGAGKTTFTKGLAEALGVDEAVQSPTFTINRMYDTANGLRLAHYDFYRLNDAGMLASELAETVNDPNTVTVVEWADIVTGVLPDHTLRITIQTPTEDTRTVTLAAQSGKGLKLVEEVS